MVLHLDAGFGFKLLQVLKTVRIYDCVGKPWSSHFIGKLGDWTERQTTTDEIVIMQCILFLILVSSSDLLSSDNGKFMVLCTTYKCDTVIWDNMQYGEETGCDELAL